MRRFFISLLLMVLMTALPVPAGAQETGFTRDDRDRLIRLEATLQTFMEQTDQRFRELREDMNKRFEQVDKRFDQLTNFLWMLVGIFTTLTVAVIGFAYWDRRTIIRKAKEETIEAIEQEGRLVHLIQALRRLAEEDEKLAGILRSFGLL
jgi:nitrate reductase NapE component